MSEQVPTESGPPEQFPPPAMSPEPASPATTLWRRIAALVVVAAIVAAAGGAGVGWSLARALSPRSTANNSAQAESPIQASNPAAGGNQSSSSIAARVDPAIVDINTVIGSSEAAGTGMIISSSGEVLTNNHVVEGSTSITVSVYGRSQTYTAHVVGADPSQDVAVIKIEGVSGLPTVSFAGSSSLRIGQNVSAIGNALGRGGKPHITEGTITALDQTITASEGGGTSEQLTGMIESDAVIYPGDSGGALVNSSGQVVGMITAGQASGFRTSSSDVGYAIPSDTALAVANRIRAHEKAPDLVYGQVGFLGVSVRTLDSFTASQLGLNLSSGALVVSVEAGSPAEMAGITQNSVITSVGGSAVTSTNSLGTAVKAHLPGEQVSVTWVNSSGTHSTSVTLAGVNA